MTFLQNSLPRRCESIDKLSNASQICPVPMISVCSRQVQNRGTTVPKCPFWPHSSRGSSREHGGRAAAGPVQWRGRGGHG